MFLIERQGTSHYKSALLVYRDTLHASSVIFKARVRRTAVDLKVLIRCVDTSVKETPRIDTCPDRPSAFKSRVILYLYSDDFLVGRRPREHISPFKGGLRLIHKKNHSNFAETIFMRKWIS